MLGTGLIAGFHTATVHGQRSHGRFKVVDSRTAARGDTFSEQWGIRAVRTDMRAAIRHPDTDVVIVATVAAYTRVTAAS